MTIHALYRFYDQAGDLLYVGITLDPTGRWRSHRVGKPWWTEVATITVETHPDRETAMAAEKRAIQTDRPRYNVTHNTSSWQTCWIPDCTPGTYDMNRHVLCPHHEDDEPPLTPVELRRIEAVLATPGYYGPVLP